MDRLQRDARTLTLVARLSMASAVLSVPLVIGAILLLWYVPMGIFIAVAVHGFYMTPFYYRRREDLLRTLIIRSLIEQGAEDIGAIAEGASVSPEYAERLLSSASEKGYIPERTKTE